jgi:hypothetical protein
MGGHSARTVSRPTILMILMIDKRLRSERYRIDDKRFAGVRPAGVCGFICKTRCFPVATSSAI